MKAIVHKNATLLTCGLVAMTALSGAALASVSVVADSDTVIDDVALSVPSSCSMEGTNTSHSAEVPNGTYVDKIGTTTFTIYCNDAEGFSIYAIGFTNGEHGKNTLVGASSGLEIETGTATYGPESDWAMKLETSDSATYPITLLNGYEGYSNVPSSSIKVATRVSGTNTTAVADGATLTSTYAAYMNSTQAADTYNGKVKYTLVHPASEIPLQPQTPTQGCINYFANASNAVGTMGCQSVSSDGASIDLLASNFSREGYGFAGWSDAYDYATNQNAHFYGPNEQFTVPEGTTANGLSLYAVWVKSTGSMQSDATTACNKLTAASYNTETGVLTANLSSITALTDDRDGDTYAVAKLSDGNCWMIENLRLADTHQEGSNTVPTTLTTTNTNNPLNDGNATNPTVTLKHNYADTDTHTDLSATSSVAYNADTAPNGWCSTNSAACDDQSRLRTDNTVNRVSYQNTDSMSGVANLYSYGNYYNWYSATAGRGTYSTGSNAVTAGDLCPANWHLPYGSNGTGTKGGKTSGGFSYLDTMMGGTGADSSTNSVTGATMSTYWRQFPNNFVYSGNVSGATLSGRGSYGYYWSSTATNNGLAYYLYFYSSFVSPGTYSLSKYNGRVVRCVVAPGA